MGLAVRVRVPVRVRVRVGVRVPVRVPVRVQVRVRVGVRVRPLVRKRATIIHCSAQQLFHAGGVIELRPSTTVRCRH